MTGTIGSLKSVLIVSFSFIVGVCICHEDHVTEIMQELRTEPLIEIEKQFTGSLIDPFYHNNVLSIHFQCPALFEALLTNESSQYVWPPPTAPPDYLKDAYTMLEFPIIMN